MLPWIVTGRIAASDKQRFERHLSECADCRAELEQQRELCEKIRGDEAVMLAPQASLQKLMARIDSNVPEPLEPSNTTPVSLPKLPLKTRTVSRWLAFAAALQTIAIAALLGLVWQQREAEMNAPRFTTLSAPAAQPSGALLRVVFSAQMTNAELQQLMRSVDATVVAGPTEAGVYTLRLTRGSSAQDIGAALTQVRADPNVVFAESLPVEARR